MSKKKSLVRALEEAQRISANNPDVTVWVMDRPKRKAVVVCFEWVYRERILEGWYTHCKFKGGVKINA